MGSFSESTIASLVAAMIVALAALLWGGKARRIAGALAGYLQQTDVRAVHADPDSAKQSIQRAFSEARKTTIMVGRGIEFANRYYDPLFFGRGKCISMRFLVPETEVAARKTDWVGLREKELALEEPVYRTPGTLASQIRQCVLHLQAYSEACPIEVRRYDAPYIGWIVLTDTGLYFAPATSKHFKSEKVYEYGVGPMYAMFSRYVELIWNESRPMTVSNITQKTASATATTE